jgi:hypothetical protein
VFQSKSISSRSRALLFYLELENTVAGLILIILSMFFVLEDEIESVVPVIGQP